MECYNILYVFCVTSSCRFNNQVLVMMWGWGNSKLSAAQTQPSHQPELHHRGRGPIIQYPVDSIITVLHQPGDAQTLPSKYCVVIISLWKLSKEHALYYYGHFIHKPTSLDQILRPYVVGILNRQKIHIQWNPRMENRHPLIWLIVSQISRYLWYK